MPPLTPGVNQVVDVGVLVIVTGSVVALVRAESRIGATVLLGGVGVAMTVQIFLLVRPMSASPSCSSRS